MKDDLRRIIEAMPPTFPLKYSEASLFLFQFFTGSRAVAAHGLCLCNIQQVRISTEANEKRLQVKVCFENII